MISERGKCLAQTQKDAQNNLTAIQSQTVRVRGYEAARMLRFMQSFLRDHPCAYHQIESP